MTLLEVLLTLAVLAIVLDLAHMTWCEVRSQRRFRDAMAPRRTIVEDAAGRVA